ncbi:MAG: YkvI family membrane protein [Galactobacter sp.]
MVLITYVCVEFITTGRREKFAKPSDVFSYYCGKYIGKFFDYFSILFVFLSFTVMVSGAGAVFEEHYALSKYIGGIAFAAVVGLTAWFGLNRLVDIIGKVGPVIAIIAILLGLAAIFRNPSGLGEGHNLALSLDITTASSNWFLAGLSYVGFCMLWLAAFLAALGATSRSKKDAIIGATTGGMFFSLSCIVVGLGLLATIETVFDSQIPMLVIAKDLSPVIAAGISAMILAGIYTTGVPLLWTVSQRFWTDGTRGFKYGTVALAALGTVVGLILPFDEMVNLVYVINGYVGIVLLVFMLYKTVTRTVAAKRQTTL